MDLKPPTAWAHALCRASHHAAALPAGKHAAGGVEGCSQAPTPVPRDSAERRKAISVGGVHNLRAEAESSGGQAAPCLAPGIAGPCMASAAAPLSPNMLPFLLHPAAHPPTHRLQLLLALAVGLGKVAVERGVGGEHQVVLGQPGRGRGGAGRGGGRRGGRALPSERGPGVALAAKGASALAGAQL